MKVSGRVPEELEVPTPATINVPTYSVVVVRFLRIIAILLPAAPLGAFGARPGVPEFGVGPHGSVMIHQLTAGMTDARRHGRQTKRSGNGQHSGSAANPAGCKANDDKHKAHTAQYQEPLRGFFVRFEWRLGNDLLDALFRALTGPDGEPRTARQGIQR